MYEINNLLYLNVNTRPFFIGQEASIIARLEHNTQTDKTKEIGYRQNV